MKLIIANVMLLVSFVGLAQNTSGSQNGWKDFDFHMGTWKTTLKRLVNPLSGSNEWADYEGTTVVRPLLDGRANLVELKVEGPSGKIEGMSLRLYDPHSQQWSLNFANIRSGQLTPPTIGTFKNGQGVFYNQDTYNGKSIFVRFIISNITEKSCHFEQAFSGDGGKTWEVNWIADDNRINSKP